MDKEKTIRTTNLVCMGVQALLCTLAIGWLFKNNGKVSTLHPGDRVTVEMLVVALMVFTAITCMFHGLYASDRFGYNDMVKQGRNKLRWFEYSITATLMIWVVAVSCGVKTVAQRALVVVCTFLCMLCGLGADVSDGRAFSITLLGWACMCVAYYYIISEFFKVAEFAPGFVWAIVVGLLVLYISFGIIHLVHLYVGKTDTETNCRLEMAYSIDSMVSKSLLVLLLLGGLIARKGYG